MCVCGGIWKLGSSLWHRSSGEIREHRDEAFFGVDEHRTVGFLRVIPLGGLSPLPRGLVGVGMGYLWQKHACCSEVRPGLVGASTALLASVLKIEIGF